MGRRFKNTSAEMHDWEARAQQALIQINEMPDGPERAEAIRKTDLLRAAADMRRVLSRSHS